MPRHPYIICRPAIVGRGPDAAQMRMTPLIGDEHPHEGAVRIVWPGVVLAVALGLSVAASAAPVAPHPLETAIVGPGRLHRAECVGRAGTCRFAGARAIKIPLFWNESSARAAPARVRAGRSERPGLHLGPTRHPDPLRPCRHGLMPIVYIAGAHHIDGALVTLSRRLPAFALASVRRYPGHLAGLPRVGSGRPGTSRTRFRRPVQAGHGNVVPDAQNALAASVHMSRVTRSSPAGWPRSGPRPRSRHLELMRSLLASAGSLAPRDVPCPAPLRHLVDRPVHGWRPDPPREPAGRRLIAELPEMKAVLDAGVRLGNVATARPSFWVTEFSWATRPTRAAFRRRSKGAGWPRLSTTCGARASAPSRGSPRLRDERLSGGPLLRERRSP